MKRLLSIIIRRKLRTLLRACAGFFWILSSCVTKPTSLNLKNLGDTKQLNSASEIIPISDTEQLQLAQRFTPILMLDKNEKYLPVSLEYLFNTVDINENLENEKISIRKNSFLNFSKSSLKDLDTDFKNLTTVLSQLNSNNLYLDFYPDENFIDTKQVTHLQYRFGTQEHTAVYYKLKNYSEELYSLDYYFYFSGEISNKTKKTTQFFLPFDLEIVSILISKDTLNPKYLMFHNKNTMYNIAQLDSQNKPLQQWKSQQIIVNWEKVITHEEHPTIMIAKDSHNLYPELGIYAFYKYNRSHEKLDSCDGSKTLIERALFNGTSHRKSNLNDFSELQTFQLKSFSNIQNQNIETAIENLHKTLNIYTTQTIHQPFLLAKNLKIGKINFNNNYVWQREDNSNPFLLRQLAITQILKSKPVVSFPKVQKKQHTNVKWNYIEREN